MSATIGDNIIFGYETGIQLPFVALPGTFPTENALVMMGPALAFGWTDRTDVIDSPEG